MSFESFESFDNSEHVSSSTANIKKYASDVAAVTNYADSFMHTLNFLESQFKFSTDKSVNLMRDWQEAGIYPTEKQFHANPEMAADLLRINLYSRCLSLMEMQKLVDEADGRAGLNPEEHKEWVGSVFGAISMAESNRHDIGLCQPEAATMDDVACEFGVCPLRFITADVRHEVDQFRLKDTEMQAADSMRLVDRADFVTDENMRLRTKLNRMRVNGIAPAQTINAMISDLSRYTANYDSLFYRVGRTTARANFVPPSNLSERD